ncbi:MAG: UvrD-helicase domain-containing protein, partial [Oscillospiraceae bacterium]
MKPTEQQKKAIEWRGSSLVVSAGAGSGKTSVIVSRIADMTVGPGRCIGADRILCVTFTNSAAAELRSRIQSAMRSAE